MAKQQQKNRLVKNNRGEVALEQNFDIDDSLLPCATELEKLKEIDPSIIQWIMKRTEIEQDARISFNKNAVKLNIDSSKKIHRFNFTVLILSFFLFISVLALSGFFIYKGLTVEGTFFGGSTLIVAIVYFVRIITYSKKN
jgi:uncharacterized membrane protein